MSDTSQSPPSSSPRISLPDRLLRKWYACPFRWQILMAIAVLTLLTGLIGGILAVLDSRTRAAVETRSNIELWHHHITAQAKEIDTPADLAPFSWRLAQEMAQVRHVSITVLDAEGKPLAEAQGPRTAHGPSERESAPDWFIALVQPTKDVQTVPILTSG